MVRHVGRAVNVQEFYSRRKTRRPGEFTARLPRAGTDAASTSGVNRRSTAANLSRLDARLDLSRAERPSLNGIVLLRRVVVAPLNVGKTVRIAQIAPLAESVPPKLYGGTERVVS